MTSIIVSEKRAFLTATGGLREGKASFLDFLEDLGLTKQSLADELGIWPETVSRWGDIPPVYAVAYLELLCETRALREKLNGGL